MEQPSPVMSQFPNLNDDFPKRVIFFCLSWILAIVLVIRAMDA
jgi:hypothetical protein